MKIFLAAALLASAGVAAGEGSNWGTMDPKLCSIILSVWNHLPYTQQCLETLFRHTRGTFELIVINNGSTDATAEYLKNLHPDTPFIRGYKVITNPQNIGIARALNQGLEEASGDYLTVISNDLIFEDNWLEDLIDYLDKNPGAGAVCPYTLISGDLDTFPERAQKHIEEMNGMATEGFLAASWVMTRKILEEIGLLDEQFEVATWEDIDYYLRLLKSGYRPKCLHKVVLYHYKELTRKHFQGTYKQENKKKFDLKYGLAPTDDWRKLANEIRGFKV